MQLDLSAFVFWATRNVEKKDERTAYSERHRYQPIKAEGGHEIAETLLGKDET
jgi:hypothetical protein